jgi:hypothetical protein
MVGRLNGLDEFAGARIVLKEQGFSCSYQGP